MKTSSLVGATVVGAVTGGKVVKTAPWQKVGLSTTKIEIYFERENVIVFCLKYNIQVYLQNKN